MSLIGSDIHANAIALEAVLADMEKTISMACKPFIDRTPAD